MFVDTSVPLWAFFDLYGSTAKIRLANVNESQHFSNIRSSLYVDAPPSRTSDPSPNRLRELAAIRVELPPLENRDNVTRELEHNASNESTERLQSGRRLRSHYAISDSSSDSDRPSPAMLELMSNLAISAAERVALPPPTTTPTVTRASTRSPLPATTDSTYGFDALSLLDRDSGYRSSALRAPVSNRTALSSVELDTLERPITTPRSSSVNPRTDDSRLSCSPSNLIRFDLPTTSALSSSSSSNAALSASTDLAFNAKADDKSNLPGKPTDTSSTGAQKQSDVAESECVICMSERVNCVLYRCGHMCLCIKCAKETRDTTGSCPICRQIIIDVIRCYAL